jgi:hypothetical protein
MRSRQGRMVRRVLAYGQRWTRLTRSSRSEMKRTLSTCLRLSGVTATAACAMVKSWRLELDLLRFKKGGLM